MSALRQQIYRALDPAARVTPGVSPANAVVLILVVLSIVVAVLETEPTLGEPLGRWFDAANLLIGVVFLIEFGLRLWSEAENPVFQGRGGRWAFLLTWHAQVDFWVLFAIWAELIFGLVGTYVVILRLLRAFRIVSLTRNSLFSHSLRLIGGAVHRRRGELMLSALLALVALLVSSVSLYVAESGAQPEAFGSIPRAMWWAVATITTVGYGDVYPVTVLGKVLAGLAALSAVALIAVPAGVMAGAFTEAFSQLREHRTHPDR